jgi:hypothetical protein
MVNGVTEANSIGPKNILSAATVSVSSRRGQLKESEPGISCKYFIVAKKKAGGVQLLCPEDSCTCL